MRAFIVFASTLAVASAGLIAAPGAVQTHAQDELGQYTYSYAGGPSSKVESRTADGVVRGSYSYIDGAGIVQSVNYVADPVNGFRTAATNLPVGPAPAVLAAAPVAAVRAVAAPAATVLAAPAIAHAPAYLHAPAFARAVVPAAATIAIGQPTYTAYAAPLNNGAVHSATLPVAPIDTPEVQAARLAHFAAKSG